MKMIKQTNDYNIIIQGGWNNNPNAYQFHYIYRRILGHCGLLPSKYGNVIPFDDEDDYENIDNIFEENNLYPGDMRKIEEYLLENSL